MYYVRALQIGVVLKLSASHAGFHNSPLRERLRETRGHELPRWLRRYNAWRPYGGIGSVCCRVLPVDSVGEDSPTLTRPAITSMRVDRRDNA